MRYPIRLSKKWTLIFTTMIFTLSLAVWGWADHNPFGGSFFSTLKTTNFRVGRLDVTPNTEKDPSTHEANAYFYVGAKDQDLSLNTYALANTEEKIGFYSVAKATSTHPAIGALLYGEAASTSSDNTPRIAFGANPIARTSSASSHAVGTEINAFNRSGSTAPIVYGIHIVNGGNAATDIGLLVVTGGTSPRAVPDHGIVLGGPNTTGAVNAPATITGILIDETDGNEAIRISADNRIALSQSGTTYIRYNSTVDRIEIVRDNTVVAQY